MSEIQLILIFNKKRNCYGLSKSLGQFRVKRVIELPGSSLERICVIRLL